MISASNEAELSSRMIMEELARHRATVRAYQRGRVGRGILRAGGQAVLPATYSTLVTIISITEAFFPSVLQTKIEDSFDVTYALMKDAQDIAIQRSESAWQTRLDNARRWFGIDSRGTCVPNVLAFAEVRNAVVHGVGELTRRQMGKDLGASTMKQLATVGVTRAFNRLVVDDHAIEGCARDCVTAIAWLDGAAAKASLAPVP